MRAVHVPLSLSISVPTPPLLTNPRFPHFLCQRSIKSRIGAAKRWNSSTEPSSNSGFGLDWDEELEGDSGGGRKQRVWWSDDGDDEEDDEFDLDEDDEFWGFKILKGFGWMVPAIAISMLLGTGPNPFLMALAVPLGQTLISLAFDKVSGMAGEGPRPRVRTRPKKAPFTREARTNAGTEQESTTREGYQSWVSGDGLHNKKGDSDKNSPRFGGWDDLDMKGRDGDVPRRKWSRKEAGPVKKRGKMSRVGRVKETPLLLRLLIAAFPFLGSWTRLLF